MITRIDTTQITVVKGQPSADELDALAAALTQLVRQRAEAAAPADRNLWGESAPAAHPQALFNPHAFDSTAYF